MASKISTPHFWFDKTLACECNCGPRVSDSLLFELRDFVDDLAGFGQTATSDAFVQPFG